jgi:hypothetical protein
MSSGRLSSSWRRPAANGCFLVAIGCHFVSSMRVANERRLPRQYPTSFAATRVCAVGGDSGASSQLQARVALHAVLC